MPNLKEERKLWKRGFKRVVGLDESGRGSLVGPVVAAAVMINSKLKTQNSTTAHFQWARLPSPALLKKGGAVAKLPFEISKLRDSKKLSSKQREQIYKIITKNPMIEWGIGQVSERVIDKINIKNAAELAMARAINHLKTKSPKLKIDYLIIDGNNVKNLKLKTYNLKLIIKADEKVLSCTIASIIAKVSRDKIIQKYHKKYPCYGFDKHKGYLTKYHLKALKKYGPLVIHRKSFHPLKNLV